MDEACLNVGKVTDAVLLQEMDSKLKGHKHYSSRRYGNKLDFQLLSLGGGEDSQGSFVPNFLHLSPGKQLEFQLCVNTPCSQKTILILSIYVAE